MAVEGKILLTAASEKRRDSLGDVHLVISRRLKSQRKLSRHTDMTLRTRVRLARILRYSGGFPPQGKTSSKPFTKNSQGITRPGSTITLLELNQTSRAIHALDHSSVRKLSLTIDRAG